MRPLAIGIAVGTLLIGGSAWAATVDLDWCLSGCGGPNINATISVGDTVRWTWTDSLSHTVDSVTGPATFSSGLRTGVGSQFSQTFTQAGTSRYECVVHGIGSMGGTITVVALPPPPVPTLAFWWQVTLLLLLAGVGAFLVSRRKLARERTRTDRTTRTVCRSLAAR